MVLHGVYVLIRTVGLVRSKYDFAQRQMVHVFIICEQIPLHQLAILWA
jgi:hypothetical protein